MKRILFLLCLIGVFASNVQIDAQVSRSAMIEDSDFKPGMKFMGGVGFGYSVPFFVEEGFISVEGSFSLGSFENRYNLEFIARPSFRLLPEGDTYVDEPHITCICPLMIAPRYNMSRVSLNNFYFYIQPELGYAINAGGIYGARLGLGLAPLGAYFMEVLGCMKPLGAGTLYETNFLFFTAGYSFNFKCGNRRH